MPATADVVIVGGGVFGCSIAYHLASKGAGQIVVIERKQIGAGPTSWSTAMVRRWTAMDFLTRSANQSADIFRNWKDLIGGSDPGYREIGYMVLANQDGAANLIHNVNKAQRLGSRVELISPEDVKALVSEMVVDDLAVASYEAESGYADPLSTTTALADRARELGVIFLQNVEFSEILTRNNRIAGVRTARGEIESPAVVVAAGPWSSSLLEPLDIRVELKALRHQMCVFHRPVEFASHPSIVDTPNSTYMRPELGDVTIFGVGAYQEQVDPDHYNLKADPDEINRCTGLIVNRIPVMEAGESQDGYASIYDVTPDRHPVLGAINDYPGLHACFGWSGHGFKHAPVIGGVIADVVLTGQSAEYDLTPFRWTRFQQGDLLPSASPLAPAADKVVH